MNIYIHSYDNPDNPGNPLYVIGTHKSCLFRMTSLYAIKGSPNNPNNPNKPDKPDNPDSPDNHGYNTFFKTYFYNVNNPDNPDNPPIYIHSSDNITLGLIPYLTYDYNVTRTLPLLIALTSDTVITLI